MSGFSSHGPSGGGGVRPRGADRPANRDETVADHWPGYLKDGYFDAEGNLQSSLVTAEKVEPLIERMANGGLTTNQVRRFFQHCRSLESQLKACVPWPRLRPKFEFLAAAAADAYGKQSPKIPSLFHSFIRRNVDTVKCERDFLSGFMPHFEALVGFGSLYLKKER